MVVVLGFCIIQLIHLFLDLDFANLFIRDGIFVVVILFETLVSIVVTDCATTASKFWIVLAFGVQGEAAF